MSRRHRRRGSGGYAGLELVAGLGLLLTPVALLVVTLPTWPERQSVARAAADEAARTVALASDWETGTAAATALVAELAHNHGLDPADLTVRVGGSVARGEAVRAEVTVVMPALRLPGLGAVDGWRWTASHTEYVDRFGSLPR